MNAIMDEHFWAREHDSVKLMADLQREDDLEVNGETREDQLAFHKGGREWVSHEEALI